MQSGGWERWGAIAGILYSLLFVVGVGLIVSATPDAKDTNPQIFDFFDDKGHQAAGITGAYLVAVAGLAMLLFLTVLRRAIDQSQPSASGVGQLAFVCGVISVAMLYVFAALAATVPATLALDTVDAPDPVIVRFLPQAGFGVLLIFGAFAAIGLILSTSIYSLRTAFLPRWHAWFGLLCAVILLFAVNFVPVIALPLWVLVTSVLLLRHRPADFVLVTESTTRVLVMDAPIHTTPDVIEPDDDAEVDAFEPDNDPTQSKTTP